MGSPVSWLWELNCSSLTTPLVNTNASWTDTLPACDYEVCLTVTNAVGCGDRQCDSIAVLVGLEEDLNSYFRLFPNPVQEHLRVEWGPQLQGKLAWSLLDLQGRAVRRGESVALPPQPLDLDLARLEPGTYFFRIENKGKVYVRKIVAVR